MTVRVKNIDKLVSDIIVFMEAQYRLCFESFVTFILCREESSRLTSFALMGFAFWISCSSIRVIEDGENAFLSSPAKLDFVVKFKKVRK